MKRRNFLALSAIFTLFGGTPAIAAKKPATTKAPVKSTSRTTAKTSKKTSTKKTANVVATEPKKPAPNPHAPVASEDEMPSEGRVETRNAISLPEEPVAQWKYYDIRSTITLSPLTGKARVWLPLVHYKDTPWERSLGYSWQGNFENAGIYRDPVADMEVFYADWSEKIANPQLQIVSQIATQDRHFDVTRRNAMAERTEVLRQCLRSTELVPLDTIIRRTAERAIGRVKDPLAQGKAIYDWVVENVIFEPDAPGVGSGNISKMLESGNLYGKSADIALLFVGMCRAMGIPARPVFGLRIDNSRLFGGLGASGDLSTQQHCRAEFYAPGYGWVPVDPADVRKAVRIENLGSADSRLTVLKKLLFGFWEMNWVPFNNAQDVVLRGAGNQPLPFLIYPVLETADRRFDSLDASRMTYAVTANRTEG